MGLRRRIKGAKAKILTWEWTTNFDGIPFQSVLEKAFAKDFPKTCKRLENGGSYTLLPMISFNSQEGRKFRYMVIVWDDDGENPGEENSRRIPYQAQVFGAADCAIRNLAKTDNTGNYFVWNLLDEVLYLLVFSGGRLVHWSEETWFPEQDGSMLENRLQRFRLFMKKDDLLSRNERYEEMELSLEKGSSDFLKIAARDPFWKNCSGNAANENFVRTWGLCCLLALALGVVACFWNWDGFLKIPEIKDATPVELDRPALISEPGEADEPRLVGLSSEKTSVAKRFDQRCDSLDVRIRGIVQNRLILGSLDGRSGSWRLGDSLGKFRVEEITRDQAVLACGSERMNLTVR